jgi:hypothetical protein
MAKTDIMGLLTGGLRQAADPLTAGTYRERMLARGAKRAEQLGGAVRGLLNRGAPIQKQIQTKISEGILNFENKPLEEQKRLIRALQLTGQTSLAGQLAAQMKISQGKNANYNALVDLGLQADAERYKANGMTDAQASSLINNTRASRAANQLTKNQRLNFLTMQGFEDSDPLYQLVERDVALSDSHFSSLVNQEREARNPNITVTNAKIMNVEGAGRQRVGQWKIGKGMPVYGYLGFDADGNEAIIPVTADQVSDVEGGAGLDPTVSDIKSIKILMETAGEEEKGKESWYGIFSTDWNDAWNRLSVAQKHNIATFIAQDAMRLNEQGMDMGEARVQAVKDYLDSYLKKTGLFEGGESKFEATSLEEQAEAAVKRNQ